MTMKGLGIRLYRAVTPRYNYNAPVQPQLAACKGKIAGLAKLERKIRHHCSVPYPLLCRHNWRQRMGPPDANERPGPALCRLELRHRSRYGERRFRLAREREGAGPYLHSVSIKDFYWEKEQKVPSGEWPWRTHFVKPGDGMVDFSDFFRYLQSIGFQGPLENYFEYTVDVPGLSKPFDMLGTDYKKWKLEMPQPTFVDYLKRDVNFYNAEWQQAMATPPPQSFSG